MDYKAFNNFLSYHDKAKARQKENFHDGAIRASEEMILNEYWRKRTNGDYISTKLKQDVAWIWSRRGMGEKTIHERLLER